MKLYNTIVVYDVYCVANSPEEARAAVHRAIHGSPDVEPFPPSEQVAMETTAKRNVRSAWEQQGPFVADDVSDDDFECVKGKKTLEVFEMLYTKQGKADKAKPDKAK